MLIVNTQPTYPPTGDGPYLIDRTWCLGDSLPYLNGNTNIFANSINSLQTTIASTSGNLLSLINTLSSNMNQSINVPYARLYEDLATAGVSITTSYANRVYTGIEQTGSTSIITNLGSGNFRFNSTGVYDVKILTPTVSIETYTAGTNNFVNTTVKFVEGTTTKLIVEQLIVDEINNIFNSGWNANLLNGTQIQLQGRINVSSTSTQYKVQQIANVTGQLKTQLGGQAEFWKVG